MTDKDRPTRQFRRNEVGEIMTAEGKSLEPKTFYCVFYDLEEGDYKLWIFSLRGSETEEKIDAFGGLVDRTFDMFIFEPSPIALSREKKKAAKALKDGKLREFIERAILEEYGSLENIRQEIREILTEFCLAYWRRVLFDYYGKVDGEGEDEPEGPAENIDTENNIRIMPTGSTFND